MPSLAQTIANWFNPGSGAQDEYGDDTAGYLEDQGHGDVTSAELQREIPRVLSTLHTNGQLPPPPSAEAFDGPGGGGFESPAHVLEVYTSHYSTENFQTFNDGDNIVNNEGDSLVDNSVATNIEAFGDVDFEQDIDNENNLALGEDSIAQSGDGTANTGDDAFVVGDDLNNDGTIATGPVGGSVTGDISDSNVVGRDVGDGNVIGSDLDNSAVGDGNTIVADNEDSAIGFGSGNVANDSQILDGDGVLQNDIDGDANAASNSGSGDQAVAQQSTLDESNVGSGSNESNDIDIDDSNVAFGDGDAGDTDVDVDGNVDGNVQVATGDGNDQTALNDESINTEVDIDDSFNDESVNTAINESFNEETDVDDSFNTEVDTDVDDSFNEVEQDDDGVVDL